MPAVAGKGGTGPQRSRPRRNRWSTSAALELSPLWGPDGSDPTAHCHRTAIALSASADITTTMTRSFSSRNRPRSNSGRHTCAHTIGAVNRGPTKAFQTTKDTEAAVYRFSYLRSFAISEAFKTHNG